MEGNCSRGGMIRGETSYGGFNFQGSMRDLHPNAMNQNQNPNQHQHYPNPRQDSSLPFTTVASQACEYNNGERGKNSTSEDDGDGHNESNKSKKNSPWQRVKWMDKMVKLMITALSYIGEDSPLDNGNGKKFAVLQKKGKWKSVSKVMEERGYRVSPQQCEDKFNDLNKRYKKLNEMLGRGTSCEVVENPALLDKIDYLNEKEKEEVRKIMSSKHLFYEEMCSFHNGNRLHLPHDPALQRSLHLSIRRSDDHGNDGHGKHQNEDVDDEDKDMEGDDFEGHHLSHGDLGGPLKRLRQSQSHEDEGYVSQLPLSRDAVNRGMLLKSGKASNSQKRWMETKFLELEEQKLQIEAELMELERQRFKWQRFSEKKDQKLEKMRMENEKMKLENERMTLELKRVELGIRSS